ncbi:GntP family permease [Methanospirillum stamsii]|uniref:Citrate transporter n=1 Tax=Methanospirillum stamsii TaxID=1277351 RepID=A0A2V2N7D6_9EURY|nr:GntP family permease [Methanospirillum stamsii]PWR71173.1 citrate transporter [Methanospirillum stamsii]
MDPLPAFFIVIICITIFSTWFRISPFFILIGGAMLFGLLVGMTWDMVMMGIIDGVGKVFSAFGIIILCGAVITKLLQEQNQIEHLISDIKKLIKAPSLIAGFSGYLLSVPITCCITAYIMLHPVLKTLEKDRKKQNILLYLVATGSIVSYALIYPTPVIIPLFSAFSSGMSPVFFNAITIPLSLLLLSGLFIYFRFLYPDKNQVKIRINSVLPESMRDENSETNQKIHWRAWAPFIAIIIAIPVSFFFLNLSHASMVNFIMLIGATTAIVISPSKIRTSGLSQGAKHAGIIIFDICGAGALGYVIVGTGFAMEALEWLGLFIPVIFIPFILAALIETAQGSRVVTAVITGQVLTGSVVLDLLHPVTLILLISAGSCMISYVTDPYFWLIQRTTGDDMKTIVKNYTVPIALVGVGILLVAIVLESIL